MPIVDTDVLVDIVRRHAPALSWLHSLTSYPYVSGFAVLELYDGCRDTEDARKVKTYLATFPVVWLTQAACDRALAEYPRRRLAGGLGPMDALIAQTALELNEPVYTFNTKHFAAVEGLTVEQPYER